MNNQEAKRILALHRPNDPEPPDPQVAEALEQARRDPELGRWLEQQGAFHTAMREKFQQIPVPSQLEEAILTGRKVVRPVGWWLKPAWLAAAAALVLLIGLAAVWFRAEPPDQFAIFRSRMVGAALRNYRMDIVTNDLAQIRQFCAAQGAPADYVLPKGLEQMTVTGAGLLRWKNHPVSMICFDRGNKQMVFLFVVNRSALPQPPPATAVWMKVRELPTASWSQDDKTYILAGPEDPELLRQLL